MSLAGVVVQAWVLLGPMPASNVLRAKRALVPTLLQLASFYNIVSELVQGRGKVDPLMYERCAL